MGMARTGYRDEMAITDIKEYSHLTEADVEALGAELDAIRADIEESRGARDARYIDRAIKLQRSLAIAGRVVLFGSRKRPAWLLGTALMGAAKIIENLEPATMSFTANGIG